MIQRAIRHTDRLLHDGQGMANSDISEWRQLLETYSAERLRDFLISRSSRADRLRKSLPFLAVLTPGERDRMFSLMEAGVTVHGGSLVSALESGNNTAVSM